MLKHFLNTAKLILVCSVLFSCRKDYREVSRDTFIHKVLPVERVSMVTVHNNKVIEIYTGKALPYRVTVASEETTHDLIEKIYVKNLAATVSYSNGEQQYNLMLVSQLLILFILLSIMAHLILMSISLKKIISLEEKVNEKLYQTLLVVFLPLIGPMMYLTSGE